MIHPHELSDWTVSVLLSLLVFIDKLMMLELELTFRIPDESVFAHIPPTTTLTFLWSVVRSEHMRTILGMKTHLANVL